MAVVDVLGDQRGQERDQRDRRGLGRSGTLATTVRGEVGGAS